MNVQVAKDRDALYYPFFHIQNLDWFEGRLALLPACPSDDSLQRDTNGSTTLERLL